jgi:hypothetical protein
MEKVWIVEEGEYSDYQVLAIFATELAAAEFVDHRKTASYRAWPLNTWLPEQARYSFWFDLSGNIVAEQETAYTESVDEAPVWEYRQGPDQIHIAVCKGPHERAVKVASERYARIRAHLDKADEMARKSTLSKEPSYMKGHYLSQATEVARVLAGLAEPPTPPLSKSDEWVLQILQEGGYSA